MDGWIWNSVKAGTPIGMGFRVPLLIISPWTRVSGGAVYSEVVDHTSIIQFIEKRFNVHCPNISPWRRTVAGDLTAAFDFESPPDYTWPADLPDTSSYVEDANKHCADLPSPAVPTKQAMPIQEPGTKVARPLPYKFIIQDEINDTYTKTTGINSLTLSIKNVGFAGVVFYVYDYGTSDGKTMDPPKKYTIEAGKELDDVWKSVNGAFFDLSLHGPNGFVRRFQGDSTTGIRIEMEEDDASESVIFTAKRFDSNTNECPVLIEVYDNAYGFGGPWRLDAKDDTVQQKITIASSGNWYDFSVKVWYLCYDDVKLFTRTFMGKMETGKQTITDPAMGKTKLEGKEEKEDHLDVPAYYRLFDKTVPVGRRGEFGTGECTTDNKDSCDYVQEDGKNQEDYIIIEII